MNIHRLGEPFPIWPTTASARQASLASEQQTPLLWNQRIVRNVTEPSLIPCFPTEQNGAAIIICPGGAFQFLMIDKEGMDIAKWLTSYGITAFVLKYRLAPTPIDDAQFVAEFESSNFDLGKIRKHINNSFADGVQALSIVRQKASEFNIDASKIGMIGFSAGAAVAVNSIFSSEVNGMPNYLGAIYGGPLKRINVPPDAPPLFIACANDDDIVGATCLDLFRAWKKAKRSVEIHAYSQGGHGFGILQQGLPCDHWTESFTAWLKNEGFNL